MGVLSSVVLAAGAIQRRPAFSIERCGCVFEVIVYECAGRGWRKVGWGGARASNRSFIRL